MTEPAATLRDLFANRLALVERLSRATSALQKLQQARAGAEMDVQRCEMGLGLEPHADVARDLPNPSRWRRACWTRDSASRTATTAWSDARPKSRTSSRASRRRIARSKRPLARERAPRGRTSSESRDPERSFDVRAVRPALGGPGARPRPDVQRLAKPALRPRSPTARSRSSAAPMRSLRRAGSRSTPRGGERSPRDGPSRVPRSIVAASGPGPAKIVSGPDDGFLVAWRDASLWRLDRAGTVIPRCAAGHRRRWSRSTVAARRR